jgi:hypothetical protein
MGKLSLKQFLILVGAMIINIFLVWFGAKLLFTQNLVTDTQLFWLGFASTIAGVFALSSNFKMKGKLGAILVLLGVYYFARADGIIKGAWLARLLGLASILAAAILLYIALPPNKDSS